MPALSTKIDQSPCCPSCQKRWQLGVSGAASLGPFMRQHRCERCKEWFLLVYRVACGRTITARLLGVQPMLGRDEGSLRDTLRAVPGLTGDEIEFLVTVAWLLTRAEKVPA